MDEKCLNSRYIFPEEGQPLDVVVEQLSELAKEVEKGGYKSGRILGFPGTTPDPAALAGQCIFSEPNTNNIMTHTKKKEDLSRENAAFAIPQQLERQVIFMIGDLLGAEDPESEIDGYICSGATSANEMGLWIARNKLLANATPGEDIADVAGRTGLWNVKDKICIVAPVSAHYSIRKAANLLGLGEGQWEECRKKAKCAMTRIVKDAKHVFRPNPDFSGLVLAKLNGRAQVEVDDVRLTIRKAIEQGVGRFIIVATAGTTMTGAIDPIDRLARVIEEFQAADPELRFHLHVDAAFGSMVIPFLPNKDNLPKLGFDVKRVDSIAVDFDKMGFVPYPAGIFLCRKGLQKYIERHVDYIAGVDDTVEGSRPGSSAAACWAVINKEGRRGFHRIVQECMANTQYLKQKLAAIHGMTILVPPVMNILAIAFETALAESAFELCLDQNDVIVAKEWFQRTPDECPRKVYRFVVMPHVTKSVIDRFLTGLESMVNRPNEIRTGV